MADTNCPQVQIKDGKLKGFVCNVEDPAAAPVYHYLNIPFGKSPTGKRRFMPPERCDPWKGVRDATINLPDPIQDSEMGKKYDEFLPMKRTLGNCENQSEDCLQLNVCTPSTDKIAQLPVMVWVVGGAFMRSTAGSYDASALSGMNNVVVVSPNYRANALGFLSLGRGTKCPGNNGILDIILALEWVRDNIEAFGGNPNNVTVFGESAGACIVQILMMSPLSRDLFHKAIALSGNVLSAALFADGKTMRERFLKDVKINADEPDVVLEKLQSLTADEITDAQRNYIGVTTFKPTVDGHVLQNTPENILKSGQVSKIPFMSGVCDWEGGGLLCFMDPPNFFTGCSEDDVIMPFKEAVKLQYPNADGLQSAKMLLAAYSSVADDNDKFKYTKTYAKVLADSVFIVPAVTSVTAHSAMQCPTYFYVMSKRTEFNHSDTNGPQIKNRPDFVNCDHGDSCHYIWGVPFLKGELPGGAWFTEKEKDFSRVAMRYFTNFAKTGNPSKGSTVPVEWPPYDPKNKQHIVLDDDITTGENFAAEAMKLYMDTLPKLMEKLTKK